MNQGHVNIDVMLILRSYAIRSWKMGLIALGLASCLAGCQLLPPDESISAPSPQLREVLDPEHAPVAIYGGVGNGNNLGALILKQDNLEFHAWNDKLINLESRYDPKGLVIPYKNIDFVETHEVDLLLFPRRILAVYERCDDCKDGDRGHYFDFGWGDEAGRNGAQRTLLSLLDRSDTTHLPSAKMLKLRDRVVAVVTRADYVPVVEWGISGRAKQGANAGLPFMHLAPIGGPYILGLAIGAAGIGSTVGAAVGLAEELSASEEARAARRDMTAQSKAAPIQTWLLDSVMALVLKQGATAIAGENGYLFTRVDDLIKEYPLIREAIDHALEVRVLELRIIATDSKDKNEMEELFFELEGLSVVMSFVQRRQEPVLLASAHPTCRSTSHPVTAWQVEDAKLFGEELHSCIDQLAEKIVSDFLTRFPDAASLRK